jgi:hypothetical protein
VSMLCSTYVHYEYSMYHTSKPGGSERDISDIGSGASSLHCARHRLSMSTPRVRMCCRAEARSRKGLISRRSENEQSDTLDVWERSRRHVGIMIIGFVESRPLAQQLL